MATNVVLLGTGTPRTELDRSGPATAVVVDGSPYLFDFGPGVGGRLSRAHQTGIQGLEMNKLTIAFLTHHHSDHTTGLPDLYLTSWMLHRNAPLHIYGPLGTEAMCRSIVGAYSLDIAKRTHNEPHAPAGPTLIGHDVTPGTVFQDDRVRVDAFDVPHGEWPTVHGPHPTLGFRLSSGDRTVIISGDTAWHANMPRLYADADVLVHEVFSSRGLATRPDEWQAYHRGAHTSATDLGTVSAEVSPEIVVLTHQLLWGASSAELMSEITDTYTGEAVYGTDLMVI